MSLKSKQLDLTDENPIDKDFLSWYPCIKLKVIYKKTILKFSLNSDVYSDTL